MGINKLINTTEYAKIAKHKKKHVLKVKDKMSIQVLQQYKYVYLYG